MLPQHTFSCPHPSIHEFDKAIADISSNVSQEDLKLASVKVRSQLYDVIAGQYGIGRINLLACFALFDDDPTKINRIESEFSKVTPELIKKTAKEFLQPQNRTILIIDPKATTNE